MDLLLAYLGGISVVAGIGILWFNRFGRIGVSLVVVGNILIALGLLV